MNCEQIHIYGAMSQSGCASRKMSNKQRQRNYTFTHKCPFILYAFKRVGNYSVAIYDGRVSRELILTGINPTWKFRYVLLTVLLNGELVC